MLSLVPQPLNYSLGLGKGQLYKQVTLWGLERKELSADNLSFP